MADREWFIDGLAKGHIRAGFDCGKPALSAWFVNNASQAEDRDYARVYVVTRHGGDRVLGYYSISACQVRCASFPAQHVKKVPSRMEVPAILIGKLAVDRSAHGRGLGSILLIDALRRAQGLSDRLGVLAVMVDAIDEDAKGFYVHHQFTELLDDPMRLFMTIRMVRGLGLDSLDE